MATKDICPTSDGAESLGDTTLYWARVRAKIFNLKETIQTETTTATTDSISGTTVVAWTKTLAANEVYGVQVFAIAKRADHTFGGTFNKQALVRKVGVASATLDGEISLGNDLKPTGKTYKAGFKCFTAVSGNDFQIKVQAPTTDSVSWLLKITWMKLT